MNPIVEQRPWGYFERFTHNAASTVKIIHIKKGETLSLQLHHHRSEFWRVLRGSPLIEIGDMKKAAAEGESFICPVETAHRLSAPHDDVEILEIATGDFDEQDIVRIEDKYKRA